MKKLLTLCLLLFVFISCLGNAGVFRGSGQTPTLEKTDKIQMVEEEIIMIPHRGNYPVDTSCRNLDKMDFRCRFILRNLTDQKVVTPVGFPLDTQARLQDNKGKFNQSQLIGHYGFTAGTKDKTFSVRFVPWDEKKKFSKLFLWEMTFEPKQEIELFVNYTMEGYLGMAGTRRNQDWNKRKPYKCEYLEHLTFGLGQAQFYVTETGSSWAGGIEKAVFRYYPYEFEEYLAKRGAYEESRKERNERLAAIKKKPGNFGYLFSPEMPMVRVWNPAFEQWQSKQGKYKNDRYLELVFQPYKPQKKDNISIHYVFPMIPVNAEQFERYCTAVKIKLKNDAELKARYQKDNDAHYKEYWQHRIIPAYGAEVRKNIADVILEFHGIARNNPEIADFLADQVWYPVKTPRQIDNSYKQMLLKISEGK
ncbi:MAG: hypothetical protein E7056_08700 [Lentisphaerae bacterium]|nr:hypothetical protein [Lentisphaerota bacterium]